MPVLTDDKLELKNLRISRKHTKNRILREQQDLAEDQELLKEIDAKIARLENETK